MNFADFAVVAATGNARQAALFLHALAQPDRQWLLEELPAPQRGTLQHLLNELVAMGVPADQMFLKEVLAVQTSSPLMAEIYPPQDQNDAESTAQKPSDRDALMRLTEPGIAALALALRRESVRLVVHCMVIAPWPWRDALLNRLHVVQRRQVQDVLESMHAHVRSDSVYGLALLKSMRQVCASIAREQRAAASQAPPSMLPWLTRMRHILGGSRP